MATTAQIEEQVNLEREAIRTGIDRLLENTTEMERKKYASASVYGCASISEVLPVLTETIRKTTSRIYTGKTGAFCKEIHKYLAPFEPEALATITLKMVFDCVFSVKREHQNLAPLLSLVGSAVEQEAQLRWYESKDRDLLNRVKRKYWHSSAGTRQKHSVTRLMMNREGIEWDAWPVSLRVRLGGWLVDCLLNSCNWFEKVSDPYQQVRLVPTQVYLATKADLMEQATLYCPLQWPMIIPPNDWTHDQHGGYLLNEIRRCYSLVRNSKTTLGTGAKPLAFLNQLQKTAYTLSPFVVEVAEVLFDARIQVGKFVPLVEHSMPPKPPDIETNEEARHTYKRGCAEAHNRNAQSFRRSCRTRKTMELVRKFRSRERFYLPWSFDYRGRCYPVAAYLTPQDTDFGKSLLRFADESPVAGDAERWLAFQVATTYGLDKSTMDDRLAWVANNHPLISAVATNPLGNRADWEAADEPWQFLAACEEFHACVIARTRQFTGLAVAVDATCSGLQILAGLARDANTARLVNVLPSESPQDAYLAVANAAKTKLPQRLADVLDRKVTKRTVMTIPYNAKPFSNRQYIRDALREKEFEFTKDELTEITNAVIEAMNEVVPGPMAVMRWINKEVSEALKRGETKLNWITPSGFPVSQYLMKPNMIRVELQLLGRTALRVADGRTDEPDKNRHRAATAPNLIHSLDASLLHLTFAGFDRPFTVIHDSVLCRATDMTDLNKRIRQTYTKLFHEDNFLEAFAKQIGATTPPPIIGDFDPNVVESSDYFFC